MLTLMDERSRRAAIRRQTYESEIVRLGEPKPALRGESFTEERLAEMWALCVAQWRASGRELPVFDRATMPGEIFRIER